MKGKWVRIVVIDVGEDREGMSQRVRIKGRKWGVGRLLEYHKI